ncbi:hypothetical protein AC1031_009903 [Aphanomyces cochlioides]|nr:hypothetical protein AC1031_009903 [Aphanomyces cochlioides]
MATNSSVLNATACAPLVAAVVSNFTKFNGTTFKSCAFYDGLVSTTFHLHPNAIRSNDCKSSTCSALFATLVQQLGNCSIEDDDSHTIVAVSSFGVICQASTPTTAPSNIIIYSPTATVEPHNHSSSTTTIVAIACASVVAIALIFFAWSRKRRQAKELVADHYSTLPESHGNTWLTFSDATERMSMQAQLSHLDMFRIPSAELMAGGRSVRSSLAQGIQPRGRRHQAALAQQMQRQRAAQVHGRDCALVQDGLPVRR